MRHRLRYRASNRVKIAAFQKAYRAANWRKLLADKKKYRAQNRRSISIAEKKYRSANKYLLLKKRRKRYFVNRARELLHKAKEMLTNPNKKSGCNAMHYYRFRDGIRIARKRRYAANRSREMEQKRSYRALQRSRRAGSEGPDVLRKPRKNLLEFALRRIGITKSTGARKGLDRIAEKGLEDCCPQILL